MSKRNHLLEKHYKRLRLEALLRSALCGVALGFGANFLAALAAWIFDFGGIWLGVGIGAGVGVATGVLLYYLKFKPSERDVARRVDRLGLEERVVTMLELEGEDSYIASLQRENTVASLGRVEGRRLRIRISRVLVVLLSVAVILGTGMSTVVVLAREDIIPSFEEIVPGNSLRDHIAVTYVAGEGGEIEGETDQLVLAGGETTPVVAVADDGYMFIGWDDGYESPERYDINVSAETVITALFTEVDEDEGSDESDEEGDGEEGDEASDAPSGSGESSETGDDEGDGSGSSSDQQQPEQGDEEGSDGSGDSTGLGAAGKWENSNQFIDGSTYYRDYLDLYYEMAMQIFAETGEIPPEMLEFFESYFGGI